MSHSPAPFVSVIMPAYNVEAYIEKAIQSILAQSYSHFELIIADDHSQDRTARLIDAFGDDRIVFIQNKENLGYAHNMNTLFKAAKGEYLIIQDADDYSSGNRIQVLVDFLNTHRDVHVVGSSYIKVDDHEKEERVSVSTDRTFIATCFEQMSDPLPVLNGTLMFRREIFDRGFLFRNLKYINRAQDDDWLFRVSEHFTIANVKESLYYYRINSSSMTQNPIHSNYYSIFAGDYVRFLKTHRKEHGVDLLERANWVEIEKFFQGKKDQITSAEPAYMELYIAHKFLSQGKRIRTLQWLLKALWKDIGNAFIWKKIVYIVWKQN